MAYCPECEAEIDEEFEDVGEIVTCPECGVELEVISIDPVEFDLAPMEDEEEDDEYRFDETDNEDDDWDDEEEYDEDKDNRDNEY